MRIVAGKLGGRMFDSPTGHRTHPMSEKVRGALFNALGELDDLTILDAFAGSGALTFEALSRGANSAVLLDVDKNAIATVISNARTLGVSHRIKAIRVSVHSWLETQPDAMFDIVLCDPPYDDVNQLLLSRLAERAKPGGLIIFSLPPTAVFSLPPDYTLLQQKEYGDATLAFYRRNR